MKIHKVFKIFCHCLTRKATTEYNFIRSIHFFGKQVREMDVNEIPIPAVATIKVSKEGKSAVFDTTVVQTTDNKYIYVMPVRRDKKLVDFSGQGLFKEIKVQFAEGKLYIWKNISIMKFTESGQNFLRIRTTTPGVESQSWKDKVKTANDAKKRKLAE